MLKKATILAVLMALCLGLSAQWRGESERDTSRWDFHLSTGTSVSSGWGKTNALMWVAPRLTYRASERLTIDAGFAAVGTLLGSYRLQGYTPNYAPRRTGTRMLGGFVSAEYRASDRLTVWASLQRVGGHYEPLWSPSGEALSIGLTAVSGGFSYEFSEGSFLEMDFHFIRDQYGTAALGLFGHPYYGMGVHSWERYRSPWLF